MGLTSIKRRPEESHLSASTRKLWCQEQTTAKEIALDNFSDDEWTVSQPNISMEEILPLHVQVEVLNWVRDARDLANCMAASKTMKEAVQYVQTLNLVCRKRYYDLARERNPVTPPSNDDEDADSDAADYEDESDNDSDSELDDSDSDDCCGSSHDRSATHCDNGSKQQYVTFKQGCLNMLKSTVGVQQLRMEIEPEMQANPFQKEEIHLMDFWLTEPTFVRKWIATCSRSLQHLCLVDYGQQAIVRQTPVLRILSQNCKGLRTLELRNMYLDTNDLEELPNVTSLTLRCIKVTDRALTEINEAMPALETMALVSVFGVQEAKIVSSCMKVLCLGLSTSARVVDLDLPRVEKLQLKMTCPELLRVCAPNLMYVAVCMEKREGAHVEFEQVTKLKELLFGASQFSTLSKLIQRNPELQKIFLDVPCMALGEDGRWEGVLKHVPLRLPNVKALGDQCTLLHTLSVGPGLWHSMEADFEATKQLAVARNWPSLSRMIVHVIVQDMEKCLSLFRCLIGSMPALRVLEVYVHSDSPVDADDFLERCEEEFVRVFDKAGKWKKSLSFACFSF